MAASSDKRQVRADRDKLQHTLLNLQSNAVKFTEPGGEMRLSAEVPDDTTTMVAIIVTDTGIGIPPEKLETIFDPFVQVDQRLTRDAGGGGVGAGDQPRASAGDGSAFRVAAGRAG